MSSAFDHAYTPRSCLLPGTVLSKTNATNSVTTMFKDRSAFIAKLNCQQHKEETRRKLSKKYIFYRIPLLYTNSMLYQIVCNQRRSQDFNFMGSRF